MLMSRNTDDLNRIIYISDNLPFLRSLDPESVDLVVIDPPFGKQQTFHGSLKPPLTDDELEHEYDLLARWGIQNEAEAYDIGLEFPDQSGTTAKFSDIWDFRFQITEEQWRRLDMLAPAVRHMIESIVHIHSSSMAAYVAFMALRMIEIRRVLALTGSVYLHCDSEANSYLRLLMDAIFGRACFRDEIIWHREAENLSRKSYRRSFETMLYYSRSSQQWKWNQQHFPLTEEQIRRDYGHEDEHGPYTTTACTNNAYRPNMIYEFNGITRQWRFSKETMERYNREGRLVFSKSGLPRRKDYLSDNPGNRLTNVWSDLSVLSSNDRERTGYPTQKPQALARRIIEASSEPGDLVLDCFAGCAYVPVASELAGRRWIACDMSPRAWTVVRRQFEKQPDLRIITEGRRVFEAAEPTLEHAGHVIRVRGPQELPVRRIDDEPVSVPILVPPKPEFRQRPLETSLQIWEAFVQEWGLSCWYCGTHQQHDRRVLQLDHIEPNRGDGSNDDCWNRALACAPCNGDKGNRRSVSEIIELARLQGRIQTDALMEEQFHLFEVRRKWAVARWNQIREDVPPTSKADYSFLGENNEA